MTHFDPDAVAALLDALITEQHAISALMLAEDVRPDWRPSPQAWSFRDVAAHLATADEECFWPRLQQLAADENPTFVPHDDTGTDFANWTMRGALMAWSQQRWAIVDSVKAQARAVWAHSGTGLDGERVTLHDLLTSIREHDAVHRAGVEAMLAEMRGGARD